ncbi:putative NRPS-like enzyme [Durotheca rogersii]|uniref:putative NRPS-like enzyme n=1 Tax=Durotheca rogersii TaxID=419775 RepID=UPI00221E8C54|nr:putative NRPS-like enzyme [Durotheca rogersii]KAI5861204.1 putative NRPS-like enzyme [Durotheca rogersii]
MAAEHASVARWQDDLFPHIVDRLARETPDAVYGLWPSSPTTYEDGFRTVTYAQLANVVNGLAWWISEELGPGQGHEVLTYMGPNDVRLTALALAALKTGYVIFFTSPRNSPAAHKGLFSSLKCRTLLTTDPMPPLALPILETVQPRKLAIPSVGQLLGHSYPHFAFGKSFEQGRWDPVLILHTSGSTGLPKPVVWTQESARRHCNATSHEPPEGWTSLDRTVQGKRVMSTLPPFHGAGLGQFFLYAIPFGNVVIAPATTAIVTARGLVDALKQTPADVALLVPSVVAELAQAPELLSYCADHLELVIYIGGDLPQAIGDRVAARMPLHGRWGTSEVGTPPQIILPAGSGTHDWHYIYFDPCAGVAFDEVVDGAYELVIRRDEALADTQNVFAIPGQQHLEKEYRTGDLFKPHPTAPNAWRWQARADDIIVFLNGEKSNPVSMEQHILSRNSDLSGALVIGSQRFQAALLIEPAAAAAPLSTAEQAALIERVWPSVDEANQMAPAHARVEKRLILVTSPGRPMIRASKGTIQRPISLSQYAAEIDKLYADVEMTLEDEPTDAPLDLANRDVVALRVVESVSAVTGWSSLDDGVGFFDRGMDSLQALQITRALRRSLHLPTLALSTVYQNPTVSQLTSALLGEGKGPGDEDIMATFLDTYRGLIHQIPASKSPFPGQGWGLINVILTGSTGTIGRYLLRALLDRPGIGHIFCLNRGKDGGSAAQSSGFASAGLTRDGLKNRVTFLEADFAHPSLGLGNARYEALRSHVSLIIHNAWAVNFNLGLASFRPQLAGLVNLFKLSATAEHLIKLFFVSSVGAVSGRSVDAGPAPETVLESFGMPYANGYSRSKLLSELLCDTAARHLRIPVTIARVGQVAGAARQGGEWKRSEWFPSLVISSLHLTCLPDSLGSQFSTIDWIPSDLLAETMIDLALNPKSKSATSSGAEVFNLRNPHTVTWGEVLPTIIAAAQEHVGKILPVVSPSAWLGRLEESVAAAENGGSDMLVTVASFNPAMKLLDFYREGLWSLGAASNPMSVECALAASATLREMSPVGTEWMRKWIKEWTSSAE